MLSEGVDAEAGDLVFEGGEALELGVEGVAGGFDVFGVAAEGEEDGVVDGEAGRSIFEVGVVEAEEGEDGGGADVDAVVVVAEALGVGDDEVGDFEEGWGAEEVAAAV